MSSIRVLIGTSKLKIDGDCWVDERSMSTSCKVSSHELVSTQILLKLDFNDTKQGGIEKENGKKIGKHHVTWPLNLLYQELFAFFRLYTGWGDWIKWRHTISCVKKHQI